MKVEKIKNNWKLLFSLGIIILGILLFSIVLIKQPMKKTSNVLYDSSEKIVIKKVDFPIVQKLKVDIDNLSGFWIYLEDYSLNDYKYDIKLIDKKGKKYFYNVFDNYESNIIYINLECINNSKNMEFDLVINCKKCNNVKMAIAIDKKGNDTLKMMEEHYENNTRIYYWHSILAVIIGGILLLLAKGEKFNET